MIEARDIYCQQGKARVLGGLSLEIQPGDYWLVIGSNGAGKTSLLQALCGNLPLSAGEILLEGRRLAEYSRREIAGRIAFLPQFSDFPLPLSVEQIVLAGRYPHRPLFADYSREDRKRCAEVIEEFGLDSMTGREMSTLSSGEQKKVLLASALVQDVNLIMLDEPLTFLDPLAVSQLISRLAGLRKAGKTILLVSHRLELFFNQASHILALNAGRSLYAGPSGYLPELFQRTLQVNYRPLTEDASAGLQLDV
jgi:iron complex transport system ATP-binding protein